MMIELKLEIVNENEHEEAHGRCRGLRGTEYP